ncbi:GntR family transcriptional repressor for pyruvate dehydrogenase complex [Arthrobacter sp. UYP6]|uniref:FadR/GntR family transcriptional regulator n=1 Tax=Arthrobacter sp. UYP6 TaxID=1756378 RepID=UPI003391D6FD
MTTGSAGGLETPIETSTRVDEISDRLITAIAIGEYLPGSRLPSERDLAASLQVGRMTVRAALARLVEQGLIKTRRGRGGGSFIQERLPDTAASAARSSVVRILSGRWEVLKDTCEAVALLQGTICRAAAENRSASDVVLLRECLDRFRKASSGLESQKADERLHLAISAAAHNSTLQSLLLDLEARVSISAPSHLWGGAEGMPLMEARALREHELLVQAIVDQQAAEAAHLGREHARIDLELLEDALERSV